MKKNRKSVRSSFLLFLAAAIWGVAFVAQSVGMNYMGPCTFNAARFLIGAAVLAPLVVREKRAGNAAEAQKKEGRTSWKGLLAGGLCCGLALCAASLLQQFGIRYTSVGKAGFLTTLYIIIVPLLGIFLGRRAGWRVWCSVAAAVAGMYLLCMADRLRLGLGDGLMLGCAFLFAIHILAVDHFAERMDGVLLSFLQFLTSGLICLALALLTENPSLSALWSGIVPVLYAGVLSCGVGYTLQVVGQKNVEPTAASLILSLESVISVLAGWVILGQRLSLRELAGCALVFAAVVFVQLPEHGA
ncbi:MAG: DMT family transporter [Eubacteriales bacterium]|nr:DMT family transporter [Eubacteriales bacterium]